MTELLLAWSQGDLAALDELLPALYGELHRQAARYMRREPPGHTLQTTALVHEAYLLDNRCRGQAGAGLRVAVIGGFAPSWGGLARADHR